MVGGILNGGVSVVAPPIHGAVYGMTLFTLIYLVKSLKMICLRIPMVDALRRSVEELETDARMLLRHCLSGAAAPWRAT